MKTSSVACVHSELRFPNSEFSSWRPKGNARFHRRTMNNLIALTSRELKAFWYSSIAYAVGAMFLFLQGFVFWLLIRAMSDPSADPTWTIAQVFYGGTFFYWFSAMILAPLL